VKHRILVTTTGTLEGWTIKRYLGVVSGHVVAGTGYFSDMFASFTDVFGGRSQSYQRQLDAINSEVIDLLIQKASQLGANCIVGLRIDHDEISGKGKAMFMVTAQGTAVFIEAVGVQNGAFSGETESISGDELRMRAKRLRLVREAEAGKPWFDESTLKFLCENKLSEFAKFLVPKLKPSTINELYSTQLIAWAKIYFSGMPGNEVSAALYELAADGSEFAIELINESGLLDYQEVGNLLVSGDPRKAKRAMSLLTAERPAYTRSDIEPLGQMIELVWGAFPEKPVVLDKGMFSKPKERWQCDCGGKTDLEIETCSVCNRDRRGFSPDEPSAATIVDLLSRRIDVLTNIFEPPP
jgi:uncharacterized protein YbjQ (UPF0145 family)